MATDDYLADYALLGLQPGCSLATLERAWRQGVSALHPDRAAPGSDPARLGRRMHELSSAYKRLRQFEREHGRLPGAALPAAAAAPQQPLPADALPEEAGHGVPEGNSVPIPTPGSIGGRRPGAWLPTLALVSAVAITLWGLDEAGTAPAPTDAPALAVATPAGAPDPIAGSRTPAPESAASVGAASTAPARRIRIGSTEAEVERLMGTPIAAGPELWEYGPSHVRFERGRVVGWYSSPLLPLPVDSDQR